MSEGLVQTIEARYLALTMRTVCAEEENSRGSSFEFDMASVVRVEIPKRQCWCGIAGTEKALVGTPMNGDHQNHGETKEDYKPECCG